MGILWDCRKGEASFQSAHWLKPCMQGGQGDIFFLALRALLMLTVQYRKFSCSPFLQVSTDNKGDSVFAFRYFSKQF